MLVLQAFKTQVLNPINLDQLQLSVSGEVVVPIRLKQQRQQQQHYAPNAKCMPCRPRRVIRDKFRHASSSPTVTVIVDTFMAVEKWRDTISFL